MINQSFAAAGSRDPLLEARARGEGRFIREVVDELASRTAVLPWLVEEPVGAAKLRQFFRNATLMFDV